MNPQARSWDIGDGTPLPFGSAAGRGTPAVGRGSLASFPASDSYTWGAHLASTTVAGTDLVAAPLPHRGARFMRSLISVSLALGGLIMLAMRVRRRTR